MKILRREFGIERRRTEVERAFGKWHELQAGKHMYNIATEAYLKQQMTQPVCLRPAGKPVHDWTALDGVE